MRATEATIVALLKSPTQTSDAKAKFKGHNSLSLARPELKRRWKSDSVSTMTSDNEYIFELGQSGARELETELEAIAAELQTPDSEAAVMAKQAGLEPGEMVDLQLTAREDGQAIDPVTAGVIIAVATTVASHLALRLIDEVVLPLLKRRLGAKAVGDRVR